MGMPMVANTGKLMDEIITEALPRELRWCITLSVCCRPVKAITKVELEACSDRLAEFISICKPTLLVYVGRQADSAGIKLLSRIEPIRSMVINHPGFILRKEEPDLEKKRVILQLKEAVKALYGSKTHHTNTPKTKLW
jgi:uracil-DNA glycosylase family 4